MQPNSEVLKLSKHGKKLMKQRRYHDAESVFLEALDIEPENSYILVGLGDLYRITKILAKPSVFILVYCALMKQCICSAWHW